MDEGQIKLAIIDVLKKSFVSSDANLEEKYSNIGVDALAKFEFIMKLEHLFKITLPDKDLHKLIDVKSTVEYLKKKKIKI